ncbi:MAG: FesM [Chloroflexi bacterium]|nr:FesM [Chloroflexota bacterium]
MAKSAPLYRPPSALDVLRLPFIGRVLRHRYGRLALQIPFFALAALLIYDGFTGDPLAGRNLATVVPWVHYRGFVVLALLLAGNLFCMGCPFTLPRTLAKRLSIGGPRFPKVLRSKWIAIASLLALFFAYEWLDLWASPALTAWLIIAYFVAAFVLEAVFTESPFCKYVCPLGSFNFVYSTLSPAQIGVHDRETCRTCVGKECLNGSYAPQPVVLIDQIADDGAPSRTHSHTPQGTLGCGTLLFAPQIKSNMDCIMCLDCARACPYENVGLFTRRPGVELTRTDALPQRYDLAFLIIILAAFGLINAFGMVPPVYDLMQSLATALGLTAAGWTDAAIEAVVLGLIFVVGAVLLPIALSLAAAQAARLLTGTRQRDSLRTTLTAFAPAFVPIGFGLWAAHYGFHFLIGFLTLVPVVQYFLLDHGMTLFGPPNWSLGGITNLEVVGLIQVLALLAGFVGSLIVAQRIAMRLYRRQAVPGLLPWALLLLVMMLAGWWIFSLPMEMRGTLLFS